MHFAKLTLGPCLLILSVTAEECTVYKTVTSIHTPAVTTLATTTTIIGPNSTITQFWPTTYPEFTRTINCTTTTTVTVGSSTITKKGGTKTLGATRTLTSTCPKSTCDCYTTRTSTVVHTTTARKTKTNLYTWDVTTIYPTKGIVTSTITTGKPPTTITTSFETTQVTSPFTYTECSGLLEGIKVSTATKTSGIQTITTTHTTSILPTATVTITVFSLQAYNTSISVDGYTFNLWPQQQYLELQDKSVGMFYIDPKTSFLYEYNTRLRAWYYYDGGDEDYEHEFVFADLPTDDPDPPLYPFTFKATCGGPLQCYDNIIRLDGGGQVPLKMTELARHGWLIWDDVEDFPDISVRAVGPTQGRA